MAHSNSSLNLYTACQRKFWHNKINNTVPDKEVSPHLIFGEMAHEVLYKAGKIKDGELDLKIDDIIPDENKYSELKEYFSINNWENYFKPVIKTISEYETNLLHLIDEEPVTIEREVKLQLTQSAIKELGITELWIEQPFVGVVDLLLTTKTHAIIIDYKFSTNRKTQSDFDLNSQLYLYAMFVHYNYDIPLHNIIIGYIDIPKKSFEKPILLKNGTLSRSKSQNVSQEMYIKCVKAIHGEDAEEMLAKGGYYYDIVNELALNKAAYLSYQYLDIDIYTHIIDDLMWTANDIDNKIVWSQKSGKNNTFLTRYDAYTCASCEYLKSCKPYLGIDNGADL